MLVNNLSGLRHSVALHYLPRLELNKTRSPLNVIVKSLSGATTGCRVLSTVVTTGLQFLLHHFVLVVG